MEHEAEGVYLSFSKPYMRLHEEDEEDLRRECRNCSNQLTPVAEETSPWYDPDSYRYYHVLQFFDSLEGFYKGELDLTGRHEERLDSLLSLHSDLMIDMARVRKTTKLVDYEEKRRTRTVKRTTHEMLDKQLWKEFRLKWKIPRVVDFTMLEHYKDHLDRVILEARNSPRLQKLCLSDLPPEIIDEIFSHTSLDKAGLLSATSRQMNAIGQPYLHHTRYLRFGLDRRNEMSIYRCQDEERLSFASEIASQKRRQLMDNVDFLLSRQDLIDALQTLTVLDEWQSNFSPSSNFVPMLDEDFYAPMYLAINGVLGMCQSVSKLSVDHFVLTADWLRTISHLRSIVFHCCMIQDHSLEVTVRNQTFPTSPQILTLQILEGWDRNDSWSLGGLWFLILLFPNLVTLNHQVTYHLLQAPTWAPDDHVRQRCSILSTTLRRLYLDSICQSQVHELSDWFRLRCNSTTPCTLTHFRLRTNRWANDATLTSLLESFQSAPLQVLILDGIQEGSVTLIRHIAELFPDLLGLSLFRRESHCQHALKRLKYFGWNFGVAIFDYTPAPMALFEEIANGRVVENKDYEMRLFEDSGNLARLFAVYCPSLEIMAMDSHFYHFSLSRGTKGSIVATGNWGPVEDQRNWNPYTYHLEGWEPIIPSPKNS
ncbi:hypothetical protein D9758_011639 [Tetrapyrgos nigripes]|uniref:F-box domain-containing protein n=1 Tax=Tetrapyrgos nigripes TaxID=182062 RepID=A0A8H5CTF2_9AGAR|nr:hypothetical protein D9758_011639 [Tetrapyrgos nigripes]